MRPHAGDGHGRHRADELQQTAAWIDWIHTAQVQGNLVRDFVKWDDQPVGVEAIPSSIMRGYRIAMSDPGGPVYLCFDVTDQEAAIEKEIPLPDPKRFRPPAPLQADYEAIKEAARFLSSAQNPVILADYVGRNNDAVYKPGGTRRSACRFRSSISARG